MAGQRVFLNGEKRVSGEEGCKLCLGEDSLSIDGMVTVWDKLVAKRTVSYCTSPSKYNEKVRKMLGK